MVIRATPGPNGKYYARSSGKPEYEIYSAGNIVHDTLCMADEITREEYYNY